MSDIHPILRALRKIRTSEKRWICVFSFSLFLTIGLITGLVVGLADFWFRSDLLVIRLPLSLLLLGVLVYSGWKLVWPAIRFRRGLVDVARALESTHPENRQHLSLAVDFLSVQNTNGSRRLQQQLIQHAEENLSTLLSDSPIKPAWPLRVVAIFLFTTILTAALILSNPGESFIAIRRAVSPFSEESWPSFNSLSFKDAPEKLAVGDSFQCQIVDLNGRLPQKVKLEIDDGTATLVRQMNIRNQVAQFEISNVTRTLWIRGIGGDDQTAWHRIDVVAAPRVNELKITVTPPSYSELPEYEIGPFEKIWSGSRIRISGKSDQPLKKSEFVFDNDQSGEKAGATPALRLGAKKTAANRFLFPGTTLWHLDKTLLFRIELTGADRLVGGKSRTYRIPARPDEPPLAELSFENGRRMFGPKDRVGIRLNASDDMQIRSVAISIHDVEKQRAKFDLDFESQKSLSAISLVRNEIQREFNIDLSQSIANAEKGEFRIVAEVSDSKGQTVQSEPLLFRIGTESELSTLESKLKQEVFEILRKILDKQVHAENLTTLNLRDRNAAQTNVARSRITEIANTQRMIETELYGTNGVVEKCAAYQKHEFKITAGNSSDEIASVQKELTRLKASVQTAAGESTKLSSFGDGARNSRSSLLTIYKNQSKIILAIESLVGKIDVQTQLQNCFSDLRRLVQLESAIADQCLQLQTQPNPDDRVNKVARSRILNDQNGITNRLNELSWGLLERSRKLDSRVLSQVGQKLKIIEIDSKQAADQISNSRLGRASQSISRVLDQLNKMLEDSAFSLSGNSVASPEQVRQAGNGLKGLQDSHDELANKLRDWKKLSETQKASAINTLKSFGQQLAEFHDRNRGVLSDNSKSLLQQTEQLVQRLVKDLEEGRPETVETGMEQIRQNLDQIQSQLETQEREVARSLRQQRFRDLQKNFAIWLEAESKIDATLEGLGQVDPVVFGELATLQKELQQEFLIVRKANQDLFALAIKLDNLVATSTALVSELQAKSLVDSRHRSSQLVDQLKSIMSPVESDANTDENPKRNSNESGDTQSSVSEHVQITNFEIKILQRMQEEILAETKRIELLRSQNQDSQQRAKLTSAAKKLANLQSDLIATLDKYLSDQPKTKDTQKDIPEIPEIPEIDDLPDLPMFDCDSASSFMNEQDQEKEDPNSNGNQEKKSGDLRKIETVRPFAAPGKKSNTQSQLNQKKEGEDIGEASDPVRHRLESIRHKMQAVQQMLIEQKLSTDNQKVQEEIIEELELFSTDQQKQSSQKSDDKNKKDSQKNGDEAATSSKTSRSSDTGSTDENSKNAGIQKRIDEIWGHLPERLRKNELNIRSEQFLPKYRELIKAYFKRLASDPEIR